MIEHFRWLLLSKEISEIFPTKHFSEHLLNNILLSLHDNLLHLCFLNLLLNFLVNSKAYLRPYQTSMMKFFAKIVNIF